MRKPNLFVMCLIILNLSGCSVLMVASRESKEVISMSFKLVFNDPR